MMPEAHVNGFVGWSFIALICRSDLATFDATSSLKIMGQMYKIFINDKPLFLVENISQYKESDNSILLNFDSVDDIANAVEILKDKEHIQRVMILSPELNSLWETFCSRYKIIQAAGGLVKNEKDEYLLIFRNGRWDLPKGKLEKNESLESAAIREVEEECGVSNLTLGPKLTTTYHTYELKGEQVLKESHWYKMSYSGSESLTPQHDEGIEKAEWMNLEQIKEARTNMFSAIDEILSALS